MEISKFLQTSQLDSLKIESWVQNINSDNQHEASKLDLSDIRENETYCTACKIRLHEENSKVHYTLDWHRYNVHRRLLDEDPIAEESFMESLDDFSSVSGSDSGDSDEESSLVENTERRIRKMIEKVELRKVDLKSDTLSGVKRFNKPKVYFSPEEKGDPIYGIYKCLLSQKKGDVNEACLATLKDMKPSPFICAVIMLGGGHFAAAIFNDGVPVDHKTFHSYTVRAKQGGSQSSRDSKSGGSYPKSAGASLRRYNEAAFAQHVTELMMEWKEKLVACNLILFRAVSSNNALLFGGKNPPLNKLDERLRSIPIPTRRATFSEVKRVYKELTTVELLDRKEVEDMKRLEFELLTKKEIKQKITPSLAESSSPALQPLLPPEDPIDVDYIPSPKKKPIKPKRKSPQTLIKEMEEIELFDNESRIVDKIVTALKENNDDDFNEYFVQLDSAIVELQADGEEITKANVLNRRRGAEGLTLLHHAAMYGRRQPLWYLLESGSDPAILDYRGRTTYSVSADKETRNTFRRFYGVYPEKFDYAKALIPSPLTDEAEQAKAAKLAEKRRLQKIVRKEKEKEMKKKLEEIKMKDAEKEAEEEEKRRFLSLSDREKRALAAERRLLAQASTTGSPAPIAVRCFLCGADITGKVPFEYSSYLFCTTACLAAHRRKLQAMKT